jgi:hypothetical protein
MSAPAVPGNQFRNAGPRSVTRIAPRTNSGITASERPVIVMARSVGFPRRRAAMTPARMLMGMQRMKA